MCKFPWYDGLIPMVRWPKFHGTMIVPIVPKKQTMPIQIYKNTRFLYKNTQKTRIQVFFFRYDWYDRYDHRTMDFWRSYHGNLLIVPWKFRYFGWKLIDFQKITGKHRHTGTPKRPGSICP